MLQTAHPHQLPVDHPGYAYSGKDLDTCPAPGRAARGHDRHGDGMVALGFDRGGRGEQLVLAVAGYGHNRGDNGAALSPRPRLIEPGSVHPGKTCERVAVAHEDPE